MRIVFMGTPDIAATALAALLQAGHEVAAVYTRPDKPVGRKQVMTPPPVKTLALQEGLPVCQPPSLRSEGAAGELAALRPELVVVVAYGLILPPEVLAVPKHGCINLHVSLLPKYRGAAPIQWAVINGEEETGVSIIQMDEGVDTGDVLAKRRFSIPPEATAGDVFALAAAAGGPLLVETIAAIAAGRAVAAPQQGEGSYAPQLNKSMAALCFEKDANTLHNLVRGCNPWPLAWFESGGKRIKVLRARSATTGGQPGEVMATDPLTIACGSGALVLEELLPEGSRQMAGHAWAAGRRLRPGDRV